MYDWVRLSQITKADWGTSKFVGIRQCARAESAWKAWKRKIPYQWWECNLIYTCRDHQSILLAQGRRRIFGKPGAISIASEKRAHRGYNRMFAHKRSATGGRSGGDRNRVVCLFFQVPGTTSFHIFRDWCYLLRFLGCCFFFYPELLVAS